MAPPEHDDDQRTTGVSWWQRLPLLILIALLFVIGAVRIEENSENLDGIAVLVIAILLTGVWIAVELHDRFRGDQNKEDQ